MSVGYIYVMTNPAMPGLVKIGLTRNSVTQRAQELSSTGVPAPFEVQYYCLTSDCEAVEAQVHLHYAYARTPGREFFRVDLTEAMQFVDSTIRPLAPDRFCAVPDEFLHKTHAQSGTLKVPESTLDLKGAPLYDEIIRYFRESGKRTATLRIAGVSASALWLGLHAACVRARASDIEVRDANGVVVRMDRFDPNVARPDYYEDPTRRHELRLWDGREWTSSVIDGDEASDDPVWVGDVIGPRFVGHANTVGQNNEEGSVDWHVQVGGAQEGPLPEPELMARVADGRLRPEHAVWSAGMPQWIPAGQVQPFAAAFAGVPSAASVPERMGDDALIRAILPVGRSGWAIASGYLGLFSVLLIPAPFAVATGIAAIVSIKRNPAKHGKGRAIFGIVMGGLGTVVLCAFLFSSMG